MLVLSRKKDESIIIGDDIVITVIDVRSDKVRLGISAPQAVSVHRQEVYDAIRRSQPEPPRMDPEAKPDPRGRDDREFWEHPGGPGGER